MPSRFDDLSQIGCIVCKLFYGVKSPANIHHMTGIKYRSMGKKAKDEHTIPLCYEHHQGREGIHTIGMRVWEKQFGTQEELLEMVNATPFGLADK